MVVCLPLVSRRPCCNARQRGRRLSSPCRVPSTTVADRLLSVCRCCALGCGTDGRLPNRTCRILYTAASSSRSRLPLYMGVVVFSATRSCILIMFPMPCKSILINGRVHSPQLAAPCFACRGAVHTKFDAVPCQADQCWLMPAHKMPASPLFWLIIFG